MGAVSETVLQNICIHSVAHIYDNLYFTYMGAIYCIYNTWHFSMVSHVCMMLADFDFGALLFVSTLLLCLYATWNQMLVSNWSILDTERVQHVLQTCLIPQDKLWQPDGSCLEVIC